MTLPYIESTCVHQTGRNHISGRGKCIGETSASLLTFSKTAWSHMVGLMFAVSSFTGTTNMANVEPEVGSSISCCGTGRGEIPTTLRFQGRPVHWRQNLSSLSK